MVAVDTIRASNAAIKGKLPAGLVALFVGATSGIGEHTLRTFYQTAPSPRVYFVGRSQSAADSIIASLKETNPDGHLEFIQADLTLIKNVDEVTRKFGEKEKELNVLVMSQGFLTSAGRTETAEGLDVKLTLNYFSRARLIQNLLPQLTAASSPTSATSPFGARVLSVLAAGREGPIDFNDFDLKTTFSMRNAEKHACTSNSAIVKYLATQHPTIGFLHAFPGTVNTPIMDNGQFPGFVKTLWKVVRPVLKPFLTTAEESGERHFYMVTDDKFKTGAWLMDGGNEESAGAKNNVEKGLCNEEAGEKVWKKTVELFEKIEKEGKV
ncbi:hypothetical protein ABW19_dt0208182 [Dactylella cylindrospora]|nr:hypothetical protein ABW19_dt0208182 [Dactylella cylindrospora]